MRMQPATVGGANTPSASTRAGTCEAGERTLVVGNGAGPNVGARANEPGGRAAPRISYTIICPRCVELNREETIHRMRSPKARWCTEHARVAIVLAWRARHHRQEIQIRRAYYRATAEKQRAYKRDYYRANRKVVLARQLVRSRANREARNIYARAYRERKREQVVAVPFDPHYTKLALL